MKGQIMLLTVLLLGGLILTVSTISGYLMVLNIRTSSDITNSTKAIFAAEAGIEWELYKRFKDSNEPKPLFLNEADFTTSIIGDKIKSIGKAGGFHRAFEVDMSGAATVSP